VVDIDLDAFVEVELALDGFGVVFAVVGGLPAQNFDAADDALVAVNFR